MSIAYKHSYVPLSMYGNVIALLREHGATAGVHLDIGCGYGAIAEPVRDELGLSYLGFDLAEDGLQSLREREFDVEVIDLSDLTAAEAIIRRAVGERQIASLSFLDTMEHLTNGPDVLAMLRRLADGSKAPLIISVPNITHKDIALKLLIGRLDITEAGILDYTHVALFSDAYLKRVTSSRGWAQVDARDWLLERSDQFFPDDSILDHRTIIGSQLRSLGVRANEHALVNQFVRAYVATDPQALELYGERSVPARPFLSVLIDAYHASHDEIGRILRDLEQQTNHDFNIILVTEISNRALNDGFLESIRRKFDSRIAIFESSEDVRAVRLTKATSEASGRFIAVVIEGDKLDTSWVSAFAALEENETIAVLRVGRASVAHDSAGDAGEPIFPAPFKGPASVAEWAVPGSAVRDLGVELDSEIGAADLRDFVVQSALLYGVVRSHAPVVTRHNVSPDAVAEKIDDVSYLALLTKINANPLLLPPGSAERIERLSELARIGDLVATSPLLSRFVANYSSQAAAPVPSAPSNSGPAPFLSVIIRTQGANVRIATLREALLTLAGQTSQDFEVLLVVHGSDETRYSAVKDLVAEFPSELTERISILQCDRPGRASPINDAIGQARGDYVAVFDDDDLLFAHWVETFEKMATIAPGSMLRAVATRQDFKLVSSGGWERARAKSWFSMTWHSTYDAVEHLRSNYTPFMSMAFPAAAFRRLGLRFDESLSTAEDWELATRVAMACGVRSAQDVTAVYRWWTNGQSSGFLHEREEWHANRQRILGRLNAEPVLLPPGSTKKLVELMDEVLELRRRVECV